MPRSLTVGMKGLTEALDNMRGLRRGLRNKVLRPAIKDGLVPIKAAVESRIPINSGALAENIASKITSKRSVVGLVGARSDVKVNVVRADGSQVTEVPGKILHLVEGGRKEIVRKKKRLLAAGGTVGYGVRAAAVPAKNVLKDSWSASKDDAEVAVVERIQVEMAKLVAGGKL